MPELLNLPVRNVVVEWRFASQLVVYSKMDQVGIAFAKDYPDWQRSPLTLEIRNQQQLRRFFMSYRRCFFEAISPADGNVAVELDRAHKLFEKFATEVGITELERFALRQWVAIEDKRAFPELVRAFTKNFHPKDNVLFDSLKGEILDISYVVDVKSNEGWKYNLRAGPMERDQWFQFVPHDLQLFGTEAAFNTYKEAFPNQFLYLDIDSFREKVPMSDMKTVTDKFRRSTDEVLRSIHQYSLRG